MKYFKQIDVAVKHSKCCVKRLITVHVIRLLGGFMKCVVMDVIDLSAVGGVVCIAGDYISVGLSCLGALFTPMKKAPIFQWRPFLLRFSGLIKRRIPEAFCRSP